MFSVNTVLFWRLNILTLSDTTFKKRELDSARDGCRDRMTERQKDRETERQSDRLSERQNDRETE